MWPLAPPTSERFCAHADEFRCLCVADVPFVASILRFLYTTHPSDYSVSDPVNEFLFSQGGKCGALVAKDACERVRDAISHSVDALLKATKFLLNRK
jgi:hypothetical protein